MPPQDIDELELQQSGIVDATATAVSGMFDSKLIKRYAAPFLTPFPNALIFNVARETAWRLWLKRGFNPSGQTDQAIEKDHLEAMEWLKDAADSKDGLVELPKKETDLGKSGAVNAGGPLSYSEQSPYVWADLQEQTALQEDINVNR